MYICSRAVSGIPSDDNRIGRSAISVARKSYYDEEYSVYLCGRASSLSLTAVRRFRVLLGSTYDRRNRRVQIRQSRGTARRRRLKQNKTQILCYECTLMETKRQAV